MRITYIENRIEFDDHDSLLAEQLERIKNTLREDYTDWVSEVRLRKSEDSKSLAEHFVWKGMSSWWLSPLVEKDNEVENSWLKRLYVLYICSRLRINIVIVTDDAVLCQALRDNFDRTTRITIECVSPDFRKIEYLLQLGWFNSFWSAVRLLRSFIRSLESFVILRQFSRRQINQFHGHLSSVWFRTVHPGNWICPKKGRWFDRQFMDSPFVGNQYGNSVQYLVYLKDYRKDKKGRIKRWRGLRNLAAYAEAVVAYPEAHLTLIDILGVYANTLKQGFVLSRLQKTQWFNQLFILGGLRVDKILVDEWKRAHTGKIQVRKLDGLAMFRFLEVLGHPQTIITYGELFSLSRAYYFFGKQQNKSTKFVTIQHSLNSRNKYFAYYRKEEFDWGVWDGESVEFSPKPDYFLVQGEQYRDILKEFFPFERIKIIGSLKHDHLLNQKVMHPPTLGATPLDILSKKYKILLLTPSVNDSDDMLSVLREFKVGRDCRLLIRHHPATDRREFYIRKKLIAPALELQDAPDGDLKELLPLAQLVICGHSVLGLEAAIFGVPAVRVCSPGKINLAEDDGTLPVFFDASSLQKWIDHQDWDDANLQAKSAEKCHDIVRRYFHKVDGKAAERMWQFIDNQKHLPHASSDLNLR